MLSKIQWHDIQTVTYNEYGSAIVELRVDGLNEIIWWVIGYGDKIQVLVPKVLCEKIAQTA